MEGGDLFLKLAPRAISEDLVLATSTVRDIRLVEYEISFLLKFVAGQRQDASLLH